MVSSAVSYPNADLAGTHQLRSPLPVDGDAYLEPNVLSAQVAAYTGADSAGPAVATGLVLPDVDAAPGQISLVGVNYLPYTGVFVTSINVPLPAVTIEANDLIVIEVAAQDVSTNLGAPTTPAGYLLRWRRFDGVSYNPETTKFYRVAVGGESGNVTITVPNARWRAVSKVWRGADPTDPWDIVTEAAAFGNQNPNPPARTPLTVGAVIEITCAGNYPGGGLAGTPSAGFMVTADSTDDAASFLDCHKVVTVAGVSDDPAAYAWNCDNSTVVTDVIKPAQDSGIVLAVLSAVTDETTTAEVTSGVSLGARNEVQTIQSNESAGTLVLTFDGQTTAAIAFDATDSTVETAFEGLSNVGVGDVSVTGGPLNTTAVLVEFTGALAETDVPLITSVDDVFVVESQKGYAGQDFTLVDSFNIPRAGNDYEPQLHLWELIEPSPYLIGQPVDVTVADHGTLHSWAVILLVLEQSDLTTPIEDVGTVTQGDATVAPFGSVTPTTLGAKVLAFMAKAKDGTFYSGSAPLPSVPGGLAALAEAIGDAITFDAWLSPPVTTDAQMPQSVHWAGAEDFATGLVTIKPAVAASAGTDLYAVLNSDDETTYVEIAAVAGSMYEVLELDLSALPPTAVITSAAVEFAHRSAVKNFLRVALVGIEPDDSIVAGAEQQIGYAPEPLGETQTVTTGLWSELADGSALSDYARLGVAVFSSSRHPQLTSHKLFWVRATVNYEEGGPVVSSVAGPTNAGDPITWAYDSASGLSQTHYQVRVIAGSAQDPDTATDAANPLNASTGEIVYDSGRVSGPRARSLSITDAPLGRGTNTVAVRAWARLSTGVLVVSDWGTADFDITGTPVAPGTQSTQPVFNAVTGGVDVEVDVPAGVTRAWLLRSDDSGTTFTVTEESPYAVTASSTETLSDCRAPMMSTTLRYQVTFDDGAMSETGVPVAVGSGNMSTTITAWYLLCLSDPTLNTPIEVAAVSILEPQRSVVTEQPGASLVAVSGALATRFGLRIRVRDRAERLAVTAVLTAGVTLRLVDIFGRSWLVSLVDPGVEDVILRWKRLSTETTGLRDAHELPVSLVEVSES